MEPYTYDPHTPVRKKWMPWLVCRFCGLVYLKNEATRWAIARGCNFKDHPGERASRRL